MMTLIEYIQGMDEGSVERVLVENFARESDIAMVMPISSDIRNAKHTYFRETALPTVAFRGINEDPGESKGKYDKYEEGLSFIDEKLLVDRILVDNYGEGERSKQEILKVKAFSQEWTRSFLKGDTASEPREPNGLQSRCTTVDTNLIHNSTASGGAALSLLKLDQAIALVNNPTHIITDKSFEPFFQAAARDPSLTNSAIDQQPMAVDIGRKVWHYNGLPILWGYQPSDTPTILPFTEVGNGGGSAVTSSLYVVSFMEGHCFGIERAPIRVEDQGWIKGAKDYCTWFNWDFGWVTENKRSAARLTSFTKAQIVK